MNANVQLWVDALRSGDYVQDFGALRTTDGYCVAGVACDLYYQAAGVEGNWSSWSTVMPERVREWLGLSKSAASVLMERNDHPESLYAASIAADEPLVERELVLA